MRSLLLLVLFGLSISLSFAQTIEHTYRFGNYNIVDNGNFQTVVFAGTQQYGAVG